MSAPVCSVVATAIDLANAKKLAKLLIKKTLKNAEKGLLGKINIIKLGIDAQILKFKANLLAALPAGALGAIEGAISAASKVDDLQRAIKRGDVVGAAAIAGEIADDFPMLGEALDDLGDIDICKDLPNLIRIDAGVIELSSNLKMPSNTGILGLLKTVEAKAEEFAGSSDEAIAEKAEEIIDLQDTARRERQERKLQRRLDAQFPDGIQVTSRQRAPFVPAEPD